MPVRLNLVDAISIIVGIIIGVGIFENPHDVAKLAPSAEAALGLWFAGGLLALVGALCFAELASTYPRSGGELVYLTRAYGRLIGFLFAWTQLSVIRTCSIGWLCYMFGVYTQRLSLLESQWIFPLALGSLWLLTVINMLGATLGKNAQNLLTLCKVAGLVLIITIGIGWGETSNLRVVNPRPQPGWIFGGMIFVLWAYSGWNEAAYIVSEVKRRTKNLPRALLLGTALVIVIYLLANFAFLRGIGLEELGRGNENEKLGFAYDLVHLAWPGEGAVVINLLIMISALGAANGIIFTTARLCSEFGAEHALFSKLGQWHQRWGTPFAALFFQASFVSIMMFGVEFLGEGHNQLNTMILITGAVFWFFLFLTGLSVIVLRVKDRDIEHEGPDRPFRMPLYPLIPIVFCLACACMFAGAIQYIKLKSLIGLAILLAGVPLYFLSEGMRRPPVPRVPTPTDPVGVGTGDRTL
jgi:amino acid transporter